MKLAVQMGLGRYRTRAEPGNCSGAELHLAHADRALYLACRGRRSEAEAEVARSPELDTSVSSALAESAVDFQLRDFDRLVEASRRGMALNPNKWFEGFYLGVGCEGWENDWNRSRNIRKRSSCQAAIRMPPRRWRTPTRAPGDELKLRRCCET